MSFEVVALVYGAPSSDGNKYTREVAEQMAVQLKGRFVDYYPKQTEGVQRGWVSVMTPAEFLFPEPGTYLCLDTRIEETEPGQGKLIAVYEKREKRASSLLTL